MFTFRGQTRKLNATGEMYGFLASSMRDAGICMDFRRILYQRPADASNNLCRVRIGKHRISDFDVARAMNVTPKVLKSAYSHLRELRPFNRWSLPEASGVSFGLLNGMDHAIYMLDRKHRIEVNAHTHTTHTQILMSVAHEMIHLRQNELGRLPVTRNPHNADFRRMARQICAEFGWDVQIF
jgi:hypothetical protein